MLRNAKIYETYSGPYLTSLLQFLGLVSKINHQPSTPVSSFFGRWHLALAFEAGKLAQLFDRHSQTPPRAVLKTGRTAA